MTRPVASARTLAPGARLKAVVLGCLKQQRLQLVLASFALVGVVLAELVAPWPLKIIFDHVLLGRPLPPSLHALQPLLDLGAWPALLAMAAAIAVIALAVGALSYL